MILFNFYFENIIQNFLSQIHNTFKCQFKEYSEMLSAYYKQQISKFEGVFCLNGFIIIWIRKIFLVLQYISVDK